MYGSLLLVSLAAVGVLGSALPEPDARHVPPRWRTKATRKHATKTKFYAIAPGPPSKNYDAAAEFGRFHPGLFAPKSTTIPDGSFLGGDDESSSTADPTATTASADAASSSASADWGCDSPDTPDTDLLPDASCGIYFDDDLDDFYGHYDFSPATFAAALEDFAPGLPSYAAADFSAASVPQFVTVGGQTFSTSSRVDGPALTSFSLLRARTPQGGLDPADFDSIEDFIIEQAVAREGQSAVAELQARRRAQGIATTPGRQSDLLNAQGTAMMQARADLARERARLALALANAAQARADRAKEAAKGGDAARVAQIALERKTLPVLDGGGRSGEARGVEPLAVGSKVAAAAVGAAAAGDRAGQVRLQAQSAVQNAAQQAATTPKKKEKKKKKLVRRFEALDEDDANNSDLDSALIAQLLLMGVDEQQNPDLTTSSTSSTNDDIAPPAFAYSTVADATGRFFLAADDSGTLGLTTTAPSAAGGFAPNTFAFFDGVLGADARGRLPVYFPAAMDALGVSRFRVAALNDTAFDARAAAAVPVKVDGGYAVLVPVDTEGVGYAFVACDVVASEGDGEVRVNKLFVVKDLEAGVRTLLDASTRSEVTGGVVDECFPVALRSPFGSAGL
ncbi:hypothetical protein SLS58_006044 [Diplodia intermedia]|uniref:Uncharacterized protein n=1 Tax=Diplodia intermedia TaxID=856260 RepID=A0ABR3TPP1_9PEZI